MLHPIDEGHRDPLPVEVGQARVVEDRRLRPVDALGSAYLRHDLACLVAQVAAGLADEKDPGFAHPPSLPECRPCGPVYPGGMSRRTTAVLPAYRIAGEASAAAAEVETALTVPADPTAAAFFDVDNTIMKGASLFHFAVGLARRKFFNVPQITAFARKQVKFVVSGSEDLEDMASATEAALSFVEGRRVTELVDLGEEIFADEMSDKLIPGTLALAQGHLDSGQRVWLVTATPVELATIIAKNLGLTGALGTVAEVRDGIYTGRLVGAPLHGMAKAEAVRAIAEREGLDLSRCSAYSDSANDIPMLSLVGNPVAVNPDSTLRQHARDNEWPIRDYRRRAKVREAAAPIVVGGVGIAVGMAAGYVAGRALRR